VILVARETESLVGYIGGHLTRRYDCDGEVQYLYVQPRWRRRGIASEMLRHLWSWFSEHEAHRICVDVTPDNARARAFYMKHGAEILNSHWLVWPGINANEEPRV
jgi:ribosomal protein S18 acetylase RimI-like enzyme